MKQSAKRRIVLFIGLTVLPMSLTQVSAGQAKRGITGDWQFKADFDGRQMASILSLSEDDDGKLKGEVVSFWGLSELRDVKHEGNELSFVQVNRFRDQESTTKFTGSIQRVQPARGVRGRRASARGSGREGTSGWRVRRPSVGRRRR